MRKKQKINYLEYDTIKALITIDKYKKLISDNDGNLPKEKLTEIKDYIEYLKLDIGIIKEKESDIELRERNSKIVRRMYPIATIVPAIFFTYVSSNSTVIIEIERCLLAFLMTVSFAELINIGLNGTKKGREKGKNNLTIQKREINSAINSLYITLNKYPGLGVKHDKIRAEYARQQIKPIDRTYELPSLPKSKNRKLSQNK